MRAALGALRGSYPERARAARRVLVAAGMAPGEARAAVRQRIGRPSGVPQTYPTLGTRGRPLSPMLRVRYELAGGIDDMTWRFPSPARLARLHRSPSLRAAYLAQAESWQGSAPMRFVPGRLSVLAEATVHGRDIAYLVWRDEAAEPEVWAYVGRREHRYRDLAAFLDGLRTGLNGTPEPPN